MLSSRLKKLRINKKLTQMELAEKINVTHVSVSGYESGKRSPDTETLQKIADFFNVTTDYLLGRTDDSSFKKSNEEFENFRNNPSLERWYKELPNSEEEDLEALKDMWEIIQRNKNK